MVDLLLMLLLAFDFFFGIYVIYYFFSTSRRFAKNKDFIKNRERYLRALRHAKKHGYPITEFESVTPSSFDEGFAAGQIFRNHF